MITHPRSLGQCTFRSEYPIRASGFQYVPKDARLKLDFCQYPDLPGHPPHVSVSRALPRALASWGILPSERIWPVAYSVGAESAREGIPFRVSTLRGLRPVLYARSLSSAA